MSWMLDGGAAGATAGAGGTANGAGATAGAGSAAVNVVSQAARRKQAAATARRSTETALSSLFDLTGRVAIVTGSSRGIGRAIAEALAAHGAQVVISSRKRAACEEVAAGINARWPDRAIAVAANIGSRTDLQGLVNESTRVFGKIDILVCNAASNPYYGPMSGISDEQFEKTFRNNVLSTHWLVNMVTPDMVRRRDGAIVLISSIGGMRGSPVIGAYNVTKAADIQFAKNMAIELGAANVRINCIAPGLVKTDFARALWENPENLGRALQGIPLNRIGEPQDVAGVAVLLASPAGRYITGQTLVVDGGATITAPGI
jgi:NAD(P)-dependent dehydrogenase (short-subunit alcohol dehydrogenase family)